MAGSNNSDRRLSYCRRIKFGPIQRIGGKNCGRAADDTRVAGPGATTRPWTGTEISSSLHFDQRNTIDAAACHHEISLWRRHHVAHDSSAGRDYPGLEFFSPRIEADQRIRLDRRFAVPNDVVGRCNAVWLRLWTARRRPFFDRSSLRIEPTQIAARVVRVPDRIV